MVLDEGGFLGFMDIHPIRPGHVLVIPKVHAALVDELSPGAAEGLFGAALRVARAVRGSGIGCDGLHLVLNDGAAANQTVPHAHVHVVPRRRGDTVRLFRKLLQRPVQRVLGAEKREVLDEQAGVIRAQLGR